MMKIGEAMKTANEQAYRIIDFKIKVEEKENQEENK